jgi:hypothetical protein
MMSRKQGEQNNLPVASKLSQVTNTTCFSAMCCGLCGPGGLWRHRMLLYPEDTLGRFLCGQVRWVWEFLEDSCCVEHLTGFLPTCQSCRCLVVYCDLQIQVNRRIWAHGNHPALLTTFYHPLSSKPLIFILPPEEKSIYLSIYLCIYLSITFLSTYLPTTRTVFSQSYHWS